MKSFIIQKLLTSIFVFFSLNCFSQQTAYYSITAEAKSLMCPYLSPKFMILLEKEGAKNIIKHENYTITFQTEKEKLISDERILQIVDNVGYDPRLFKITITNE